MVVSNKGKAGAKLTRYAIQKAKALAYVTPVAAESWSEDVTGAEIPTTTGGTLVAAVVLGQHKDVTQGLREGALIQVLDVDVVAEVEGLNPDRINAIPDGNGVGPDLDQTPIPAELDHRPV